ncbi:MAG: M20/M25/M40 family metallo-hydrolase [Bacteroidia bacterium]|nr:M20/M25/M40 family metallo-hydrolase [Bacteroidia bacterium]
MNFKGVLLFPLLLISQPDTSFLNKLYRYYLTKSACYGSLKDLCYSVGHRLSGSPQAAKAVTWSLNTLKTYGADEVFLQEVKVPHWVRGKKEWCKVFTKNKKVKSFEVLALGGSISTNGILKAPAVRVKSFDELEKIGKVAIEGKIVFYDTRFDDGLISQGEAYGKAVSYRSKGASMAAKYGARAVLIRSMTSCRDNEPHTGQMRYDTSISNIKIPAFALSYSGADELSISFDNNEIDYIQLYSDCRQYPDTLSYNVIADLKGTTHPDKIILIGGHLDSWDVGHGAHDDGAGIVQSMEIIRAFKQLGYKPKHTIRVVCFMNEENGLRGANRYAEETKNKGWKHVAAMESDAGGFTPRGFGIDTTSGLFKKIYAHRDLLEKYLIQYLHDEGGGADIGPLEKLGVPCIGFIPDGQRYFDLHHTRQDTFDKIHKRELELGGAAMAALVYLIDILTD